MFPSPSEILRVGHGVKLKLQYFGHLLQRFDSLEKTDAGRDWGQEEKGTTEDGGLQIMGSPGVGQY